MSLSLEVRLFQMFSIIAFFGFFHFGCIKDVIVQVVKDWAQALSLHHHHVLGGQIEARNRTFPRKGEWSFLDFAVGLRHHVAYVGGMGASRRYTALRVLKVYDSCLLWRNSHRDTPRGYVSILGVLSVPTHHHAIVAAEVSHGEDNMRHRANVRRESAEHEF